MLSSPSPIRLTLPLALGLCRPALGSWLRSLPLAVGLLVLPLAPGVLAQEALVRILTVTGQGEVRVATSRSAITLGVEVLAPTAAAAQAQAAQQSNAVVALLKDRKVDRLQTTGIQLNPRYNYNDGQQILEGFSASNQVSFEVPTEQAGAIMDGAVKAGATRIDGLQFLADDTVLDAAQQQALQKATQSAQTQAQTVFNSLGLQSQEVVGIQINGASAPLPPGPLLRADAQTMAASVAPTPVVGGEQTVFATVTLQIRY